MEPIAFIVWLEVCDLLRMGLEFGILVVGGGEEDWRVGVVVRRDVG